MTADNSRWVLRQRKPAGHDPAVLLVCVPYAGGGSAAYHGWARELPPAIDVWTLRLPGRDSRIGEPAATDLPALATEAAEALAGLIDRPFTVFGHSLGAFLGLEIVRELATTWGLPCGLLAVSARNAPQLGLHHTTVHHLADDAFLTALDQRYRAIPDDVRHDQDMRRLYLPLLRADVTMLETYRYQADEPLSCPISVYGGADDRETTPAALDAWRELTSAGSTVRMLPGGHFFLRTHRAELLSALAPDLLSTLVA